MSQHSPNEVDVAVGRSLMALRTKAGWSVSRLADHIGLSAGALVDAEAGRRRLSAAQILAASQALSFTPRDLYSGLRCREDSGSR